MNRLLLPSLDYLRNQFCDRVELHPMTDWSRELVAAMIALLDVHFAAAGTNVAPVLELVRP
jgi:hypothetical protein